MATTCGCCGKTEREVYTNAAKTAVIDEADTFKSATGSKASLDAALVGLYMAASEMICEGVPTEKRRKYHQMAAEFFTKRAGAFQ